MPGAGLWNLAVLLLAPQTAPDPYFPPSYATPSILCEKGERPAFPIVSDFESKWYSGHLAAAQESSLYARSLRPLSAGEGALRFTWLRTFHPPVVVRVETSGEGARRLIVKQLSGAGGYAPGTVAKAIDRLLSPAEVERLDAMLARTQVFSLPPKLCDLGLDGAQWIIESVDAKGYRLVDRFTPRDGGVRDLGLFLLGLSGWEFGEIY